MLLTESSDALVPFASCLLERLLIYLFVHLPVCLVGLFVFFDWFSLTFDTFDTLTRSFPSVVFGDVLVQWYAAMPHWSRPGYSTTRRPGQHTQTFPKCMCEVCVSVKLRHVARQMAMVISSMPRSNYRQMKASFKENQHPPTPPHVT